MLEKQMPSLKKWREDPKLGFTNSEFIYLRSCIYTQENLQRYRSIMGPIGKSSLLTDKESLSLPA